jgi:hypothetical protein
MWEVEKLSVRVDWGGRRGIEPETFGATGNRSSCGTNVFKSIEERCVYGIAVIGLGWEINVQKFVQRIFVARPGVEVSMKMSSVRNRIFRAFLEERIDF